MLGAKERAMLLVLSETEYCTSETLAKALGVSSKTARTLVKPLREKLQNNGADIEARTRCGYRLVVHDRERYRQFATQTQRPAHFIPSNSEERVHYILVCLLSQVDWIKVDALSEELYVSTYTISGDLRHVEDLLAGYRLTICRRPNYGIRVEGTELDLRNCIAHVLGKYNTMMPDGGAGYEKMAQSISRVLIETVQLYDLHFSEISYRNLINTVFAMLHRLLQHHTIVLPADGRSQKLNERTRAAAAHFAKELARAFSVELPAEEVDFLALNIAGKCNFYTEGSEDENVVVAPEILALVDEMLESVYESFKLDYSGNFLLRMNLGQHLVAMDIRLHYGMPVENPMLSEAQQNYPLAYALAEQAVIPLAKHYQMPISDDEIGYLAYIFQLTLEQEKDGCPKKNILVVCSSGVATSRLVAYRFEEEFKKYLDHIYVREYMRLNDFDFSKVDYIFTTVPLHQKVNVPVIRLEDFFSQSSLRKMHGVLEDNTLEFLSAYYSRELFFPHVEGRTKEEAIFNLCSLINEVQPLPQGFYTAVLRREELARTDLCPLVAFPHAYKILSKETFVAVGILDKPILWAKNEVQVLLLVSIADTAPPELQKFYLTISAFMQDTARVKSLLRYRDFSWFMQLLCGGEDSPPNKKKNDPKQEGFV